MELKVEKTLENPLSGCRRCKAQARFAKRAGAALNLSGKRTEAKMTEGAQSPLFVFIYGLLQSLLRRNLKEVF